MCFVCGLLLFSMVDEDECCGGGDQGGHDAEHGSARGSGPRSVISSTTAQDRLRGAGVG